jgi:DNA-binding transcriptional LysR family regulator
MMAPMDPHLLPDVLIFLNAVRSGSITKAANHLNTVQSNVTARIKKLEDALGVPLLSRHARGVRLTSGGEAVLPMALRLDALLNDLGYAFGRRIPVNARGNYWLRRNRRRRCCDAQEFRADFAKRKKTRASRVTQRYRHDPDVCCLFTD